MEGWQSEVQKEEGVSRWFIKGIKVVKRVTDRGRGVGMGHKRERGVVTDQER